MNSLGAPNVHTAFPFRPKKCSGCLTPSTNGKEVGTRVTSSDASSNPFRGGKISSRIAARTAPQQQQEEKVQSTGQRQQEDDGQQQGTSKLSTESTSKSSRSSSMRLPPPPPTLSNRGKAFPMAPPVPSSPFDSDSLAAGGSNTNIDRRILESRKSILDAIWKEKQESTREPAPSDIFDDPSPFSPDDKKFQLIYGTNQLLLLVSFALIVGLMVATAFAAWKLGAIHYNEV